MKRVGPTHYLDLLLKYSAGLYGVALLISAIWASLPSGFGLSHSACWIVDAQQQSHVEHPSPLLDVCRKGRQAIWADNFCLGFLVVSPVALLAFTALAVRTVATTPPPGRGDRDLSANAYMVRLALFVLILGAAVPYVIDLYTRLLPWVIVYSVLGDRYVPSLPAAILHPLAFLGLSLIVGVVVLLVARLYGKRPTLRST